MGRGSSCSYPEANVYDHKGSATPACPSGTQFEPQFTQFTEGYLTTFAGQSGGNKFSVMDEINVPNQPGEYVLGWRWDCEETDQVWASCADIVITDGDIPSTTTAAPAPTTPAPTPSPSVPCQGFTRMPPALLAITMGVLSRRKEAKIAKFAAKDATLKLTLPRALSAWRTRQLCEKLS